MRTYFYNRSSYAFLEDDVPDCFKYLDEYFDSVVKSDEELLVLGNPVVQLAENLCYRMGDIDLYAFLISKLSNKNNDVWNFDSKIIKNIYNRATLARSLLVSYLGACKSLFDAGAIALNHIYQLELNEKEQDFMKGRLQAKLKPKCDDKYENFESLVHDIVKNWRNDAIHRHAPTVAPVDSRIIPDASSKGFQISLFGEFKKGRPDLIGKPVTLDKVIDAHFNPDGIKENKIGFCELVDLHKEWRPQFIDFCEKICDDLSRSDFSTGYITI